MFNSWKIKQKVIIVSFLWLLATTSGIVRGDTSARIQMAHSWHTGEPEFVIPPDYQPRSRLETWTIGRGGKLYIPYDLGQSMLILPGDWIATKLHSFVPGQDSRYFRSIVINFITFLPLNLAVISVIYSLLRLWEFPEKIVAISCLIFLLCTTFLHYAQVNQQNNQVLLFTLIGYLTALSGIKSAKYYWLVLSGLSLGFAYLIRATSVIESLNVLIFLLVALLFKNNYRLGGIIPKIIVWLMSCLSLHILARILNYWRYGSFWEMGQVLSIAQRNQLPIYEGLPKIPANYPFINPAYQGILGVLITPAKSIFIYDPLLLPCLMIAVRFWRGISPYVKIYLITALFNLLLHIILTSKLDFWHGDPGWGARYHVTSVQLILIPLIPILVQKFLLTKGWQTWLIKTILVIAFLLQLISLVFRPVVETSNVYYASFESFFKFRVAQRVENIVCVITPSPSPECLQKLETTIDTNQTAIKQKIALLPFAFTNSRTLIWVFWFATIVLAVLGTINLWSQCIIN